MDVCMAAAEVCVEEAGMQKGKSEAIVSHNGALDVLSRLHLCPKSAASGGGRRRAARAVTAGHSMSGHSGPQHSDDDYSKEMSERNNRRGGGGKRTGCGVKGSDSRRRSCVALSGSRWPIHPTTNGAHMILLTHQRPM